MTLSIEELLAGGALTHEVTIPPELLNSHDHSLANSTAGGRVLLRPLTVRDLQRIAKATRDDDGLSAALIIQQGLAEPALKFDQVSQLPAGLARFLVDQINTISGINTPRNALEELVQAPLARACFVLAKEFGWTPEEVSGMTIGQILLYLQMSYHEGESP
jgi:hypothetical protein